MFVPKVWTALWLIRRCQKIGCPFVRSFVLFFGCSVAPEHRWFEHLLLKDPKVDRCVRAGRFKDHCSDPHFGTSWQHITILLISSGLYARIRTRSWKIFEMPKSVASRTVYPIITLPSGAPEVLSWGRGHTSKVPEVSIWVDPTTVRLPH